MAATTRRLPAYCRHKAKDLAYVTLPIDGKRKVVYLGRYNSRESLEEYDRILGDWLAKRPIANEERPTSVQDIAERFRTAKQPVWNRDQRCDASNAMRLLVELFGDRPVSEFSALSLDRFKTELVKREYSRAYGNRVLSYVKKCFRWAMQREVVSPDQFVLIDSVEPLAAREASTRVVRPVCMATVDATLPALSANLSDMVRFIRSTGSRPGEARLMRVEDVDRTNWIAHLRRHKTASKGKARYLVIPPDIRDMVLRRLLRPRTCFVFASNADGTRHYEKRALGRAISRAVKKLTETRREKGEEAIPHWHPYQLRHARATEVRQEFGIEIAQAMLGHSRIDMTQHYADLTRQKAIEVSKMFG